MSEQDTSPTPGFEDQEPSPPTEATPESVPEPSLEEIAKAYNMTPAQVIKSYGEAQKKITKQGQDLSSVRKQYQWADQFAHEINTRKGFREHVESFFDDRASVPSEVKQAVDPVVQKVSRLETYVHNLEMNSKLDSLAREGYPLDADTRQKVFEMVSDTENPDVEAHYFKIMGPAFFSNVKNEEARGKAREKNKDAYTPNRGGPAKSKEADVRSMPSNEWSDALDNEITSMFRRTD